MKLLFSLMALLLLTGCAPRLQEEAIPPPPKLSLINIIDQNGLTETISSKERLNQFENANFLSCQPYKKIMRIFERDLLGNTSAIITSYHPNGQPWQYLQIVNGRALGSYKEWYASGQLKIEAHLIGGEPDTTDSAQKSWIFDGLVQVWDEQGNKTADLPYEKGVLEGTALYYHPVDTNGCSSLWKKIPYHQNLREGVQLVFLTSGAPLSETPFLNDEPHGLSHRWWPDGTLSTEETYLNGKLLEGSYWDAQGELITQVTGGWGKQTLFGKNTVSLIQEYKEGVPEGRVENYSSKGRLISSYYVKEGLKHGEEVLLYPNTLTPKLSITWYQGKIQGPTTSWYPNGTMESQKEMSDNKKNGLLTAWYRDGSLMMIEEYEKDTLVRGEYYRRGEKLPLSEVIKGKGTATLFDPEGHFLRKITYLNGLPE